MEEIERFEHNGWRVLSVKYPHIELEGSMKGVAQVIYSKVINGQEYHYVQPIARAWIAEGGDLLNNALIGARLRLDMFEARLTGKGEHHG